MAMLVAILPWHGSPAATLVALNPDLTAIIFSQAELPVSTNNSFACDRHIYQADQNYTALPNRIYATSAQNFGVYNRCYLVPVAKPEMLKSGQQVARFISSNEPYTEVVFALEGQALSALPAGVYTFRNGGSLHVDDKHRRVGATRQ